MNNLFEEDDQQYLFNNNFNQNEEEDDQQFNSSTNHFSKNYNNNNNNNKINNQEQRQSNQFPKEEKKKLFMPQEFNKGKRTLNKIIFSYFNQLKEEYLKYSTTAMIYTRFDQIQNVVAAIRKYVGIKHQKRQFLDVKIQYNNRKTQNQLRNGLFCYQAEAQKIINYTKKGEINEIKIDQGKLKLPSIATPVPFKDNIYLLDPINFDKKNKVFIPNNVSYKINEKGLLSELSPGPSLQRMKCAIVRDQKNIFLIGGYQGQNKFITRRCQKYFPNEKRFQQMPQMINRHNFPSAIIMNKKLWVFSEYYIEYLQDDNWTNIRKPFGLTIYSFQFLAELSQNQILIFGGVKDNRKVSSVQIFNTQKLYSDNYDQILPQGICSERIWGPTHIQNNIVALSNMQAQVYPQVGTKKNVVQVIYVTSNGLFLHSLITQS